MQERGSGKEMKRGDERRRRREGERERFEIA